MTAVQQAGGQTGEPSESPSHKIPEIAFLGHKGTCNYTALNCKENNETILVTLEF